ncbi:hypothetical protein B0J13DRAFT_226772 [Dactylonectria estremocensis]|uniref:Uncharacterized protein n=1 Tax=Dactylonectria estremocensis TaxID=1079267 RepID=A0A9P9JCD3_9HYPO|nr:hypothetical protein B0J13DRAFT_226772 [Dactylonectria estremocensis]
MDIDSQRTRTCCAMFPKATSHHRCEYLNQPCAFTTPTHSHGTHTHKPESTLRGRAKEPMDALGWTFGFLGHCSGLSPLHLSSDLTVFGVQALHACMGEVTSYLTQAPSTSRVGYLRCEVSFEVDENRFAHATAVKEHPWRTIANSGTSYESIYGRGPLMLIELQFIRCNSEPLVRQVLLQVILATGTYSRSVSSCAARQVAAGHFDGGSYKPPTAIME